MHDYDDSSLVRAAQRGDEGAADELVRRFLPIVYGVVRNSLPAGPEVDDAVQETFLAALHGLGQVREPDRFRSWLMTITLRQVRARWRARDEARALLAYRTEVDGTAGAAADVEEAAVARLALSDQRREVAAAAAWLDPDHAELLNLWWLETGGQLTRAELAAAVDADTGHVAVRVQRMKAQLDVARAVVRLVERARTGRGRCAELPAELSRWDGRPTSALRKRLARHARSCAECGRVADDLLAPERLLVGLPLLAVPAGLAAQIVAAADPAVGAAGAAAAGAGPAAGGVTAPVAGSVGGSIPGPVTGRLLGRLGHTLATKPVAVAAAVAVGVAGVAAAVTLGTGPTTPTAYGAPEGGSDPAAAPLAQPSASPSAPASPAPSAPSASAPFKPVELLRNPGFEGQHTQVAPAWRPNTWGSPAPVVAFAREGSGVHGGGAAQRFEVRDGADRAALTQQMSFTGGQRYRAGVWVRASAPVAVTLTLRSDRFDPDYYQAFAVHTQTVGTSWQFVEARGAAPHDMPGSLRIQLRGSGTVWVDDATLSAGWPSETALPTGPVPRDFFGMHLFCRGCYGDMWPGAGFGTWRLLDAGVKWSDLEPRRGEWNFTMMDYLVDSATRNKVAIRYTLGNTPQWAAARPDRSPWGAGGASEPADLNTWRAYVRTVAERYKGRIRQYEMWNEPDYSGFFTGGPEKLAELTRIAREEIKRVDPGALVLSPGITINGLTWLDRYLHAGGAKHIDGVAIHVYFGLPEKAMVRVDNARSLMRAHGIGDLPLIVTEGAPSTRANVGAAAQAGAVARAYALFWAHGAAGFDWYAYDRHGSGTVELATGNNRGLTPAGVAYRTTVRWLHGARMLSRTVDGDVHVIGLVRADGSNAWLVWNATGESSFAVPAQWRAARVHDLAGGDRGISGGRVAVGASPVLLTV